MKIENFNLNKTLVENRWLWHIGFWMFYVVMRIRPYYNTVLYYDDLFLKYMLIAELLFFATIYTTTFFFNLFIQKKKFVLFFCIGFLVWIVFVFCDVLLKKQILYSVPEIVNYKIFDMFLDSFSYYIIFYFLIILLKYFKLNFIYQYHQNHLIQQQMFFELENLKAQISPHFLFNTMNNFYGLAVEKSSKLPNLMIRLSNLLRYSLYETKNEKVALENEVNYIENYIELEKIRLEENLQIEFTCNKNNFNSFQIAPLLLITFVENAFKHAKNTHDNFIIIEIFLEVNQEGLLTFKIKNNYNSKTNLNLEFKKGIGLENVKKRLEVIYPNHLLKIKNDDSLFYVEIILNLI